MQFDPNQAEPAVFYPTLATVTRDALYFVISLVWMAVLLGAFLFMTYVD